MSEISEYEKMQQKPETSNKQTKRQWEKRDKKVWKYENNKQYI